MTARPNRPSLGILALAAAAGGFAAGRRQRPNDPAGSLGSSSAEGVTSRIASGSAGSSLLETPGRGRDAEAPQQIPAKGWNDILGRTWKEFSEDQAPLVAAGVTFYTLLALFPGIAAFVALWGLFGDVAETQRDVQNLAAILPGGAITVISDQIAKVAAASDGGLSLTALGGFLLSLWSANGATKAMIAGVSVAYDQPDKRGFIRKTLVSLCFTVGFLVFALLALGVMALQATIGESASGAAGLAFRLLAWPALFAALCLGLAVLYRYGPHRERAKWRWVSWGSIFAAAAWLAASIGFSFYAANFGSYDKTYGTLGAVVGLMTWIWISGMVVLLGAELNSEIEHQTARDSTTGEPEPLGQRGATMADTIGAPQGR